MAFRSVKRVDTHWYTPEDQQDLPDGEAPLRFKVRPLNATEQADILQAMAVTGRGGTAHFMQCFRVGTIGIENALKPNGKPCQNAHTFAMLDDTFDYCIEVGAYIFDQSFDDDEEKKTSSSE